ncbi:MAG: uracil-DNA glycosylase [Nitriliruptorales bacterium]|nr:uracil-DNA glycosylase [Nitriliruptorales bacterium]
MMPLRRGRGPDVSTDDSLGRVAEQVRGCTRCRLAATRTNAVPGQGDPRAPLVLVGEAPGRAEDQTGQPFQGMAGRFLDTQLALLDLTREQVFISSVNKCRPPRNRTPRPDEVAACASYLDRQLALIRPRVVLAMGGTAAARLHPERTTAMAKVGELRGQVYPLGPEQALVVTYHPAAAMRFPSQRDPFAADLQRAAVLAGLLPQPFSGGR